MINYLLCGLLTAMSTFIIFVYGDKTYRHHDKIIISNGFVYSISYIGIYFILGCLLYFLAVIIGLINVSWLKEYPIMIPIFIGLFSKIILRIISLEFDAWSYILFDENRSKIRYVPVAVVLK